MKLSPECQARQAERNFAAKQIQKAPKFLITWNIWKLEHSVEVEVVLEKCWLHAINIQVPTILSCLQILVLFISAYPDFSGDQSISKSASPKGETTLLGNSSET